MSVFTDIECRVTCLGVPIASLYSLPLLVFADKLRARRLVPVVVELEPRSLYATVVGAPEIGTSNICLCDAGIHLARKRQGTQCQPSIGSASGQNGVRFT